jgi:hypothetical protein
MWNRTDLTYREEKSQPDSALNLLIAYHNYVNVLRGIISSVERENILLKASSAVSLWH